MTTDHKFAILKSKVQKLVEEQDYFSQSIKSDSDDDIEGTQVEDRHANELFYKKSLKKQKEGKIDLLKIIRKE